VQNDSGHLFDSIESARDYIALLTEVVNDVKRDLEAETSAERNPQNPRRLDAIRLALYNLDKLHRHMIASARILNDLRSIRRLLLEERRLTAQAAD
jgi:hypothetical protein